MLKKKPSNDEIKARRIKKLLVIGMPIVVILFIIIFVSTGSLSSLMGNSVTQYYCADSSYKLVGDKCEKTIETNYTLLGDIYKDNKITYRDLRTLNSYLSKEDTNEAFLLSDEEELAADINEDSEVSEADYYILNDFLKKNVSTYSSYYDKIGVVKKCPYKYKLSGDKCIYKETINALNKTIDNGDMEYTISFDANGGIGNMNSITLVNSKSINLPKNTFKNEGKTFAGWNVYNKSSNKWLCYLSDANKANISNRKFMLENECSFGKALISDTETISALATSNKDEIVFYAMWVDNQNNNVDVSFTADKTEKYLVKGDKVNLTVNFKVEGNNKYYYKWFTYSYGTKHHESPCQDVFNGSTAPKSLDMFSDRQGGIQLYTDDKCNIKYKDEYKTNKYICTNCEGVKAVFDNVATTSYKKGNVVKNYVHFEIADTSKQYYYLWKTYQNGNLVYTSNCQKVEANKKFLKELTIDGTRKGTITVYSDSSCKNKVTSVDTKRFICSDCPPIKISMQNDTNNNLTEGKIAYTNVNFKILDSEDNNKYYYKWRTYRYNALWVEDSCDLVKNGDIKFKLIMNGTRKGTITVYSDSSCSKRINSVPVAETKSYKCSNCAPLKVMIGNNLSSNQTRGTVISNSIKFDVYDKTTTYYYKWRTYNYGALHETGGCNSITSGIEYVKTLSITDRLSNRKGTITVYSDSSCNTRVNTVPIAETTTYKCTNCTPVEVVIDNHLGLNWEENSTIRNSIIMTIFDKKKYYYRWREYTNGSNNKTSSCQAITSGKEIFEVLKIDATYKQGTITVYSDSSCSKQVSSVPVAKTNRYNCTNCNVNNSGGFTDSVNDETRDITERIYRDAQNSKMKFKKFTKYSANIYIEKYLYYLGDPEYNLSTIASIYNDNKNYIAATNIIFYSTDSYVLLYDSSSCGMYFPDKNTIVLNGTVLCGGAYFSNYYRGVIKHELGHSIDNMNEVLTGFRISLSVRNCTQHRCEIKDYYGLELYTEKYSQPKFKNSCDGKMCLNDYATKNLDTSEFWAELFAYDYSNYNINGELNKLRRKILSDYLNLCQSKADKFNSYKNKFKYSDEKIKEFFFTKK